ncbi:MAG: hypothetical protein QI197_05560 [Candidatus Korarchaeota archaeon]|nr:hypothetical protein [Candidatus Korarchaeota archaeon]
MNKLLVSVLIILAALFILGLYLLSEMTGGTSFKERYASIDKLTFSVGEGSILKQELRILMSYGNRSVEIQRVNRTVRVDGFSWPTYHLCPVNETAQVPCYDAPFSLIAMPKELLGVDSIELPFNVGRGRNRISLKYEGITNIDMPWGQHPVVNYTNQTAGYPQPNINTTTKFYFDTTEGYMVRIEVVITDGNTTSTAIFQLMDVPKLNGPLEVNKPEKWNWGSPGG